MSASANLMLLLGQIMPEEVIIDKLEESIKEYKLNPSEDNRKSIGMHCALFNAKEIGSQNGLESAMNEVNEFSKIKDRLNSAN